MLIYPAEALSSVVLLCFQSDFSGLVASIKLPLRLGDILWIVLILSIMNFNVGEIAMNIFCIWVICCCKGV
jgi:hypothetical protein